MSPFCNDIDLLHWEPNIFRDAAFASQTLMSGSGSLAGTAFRGPECGGVRYYWRCRSRAPEQGRGVLQIANACTGVGAVTWRPDDDGLHSAVLFMIDAIGLRPRIEEMADRSRPRGMSRRRL